MVIFGIGILTYDMIPEDSTERIEQINASHLLLFISLTLLSSSF